MSHFTKVKTALIDQPALVLALADVGFGADKVEIHEVAENLYGYQGDKRPQTAEVIVRRKYVGSASNDIGFKLGADGTYEAIISQYDSRRYNREWLERLTQRYAYHLTLAQMELQGFFLQEETQEDGEIQLVLTKYA